MKLQLACSNDQDEIKIEEGWIQKLEGLLQVTGEFENISKGEVTLTFVDDKTIHQLNKEYRGIDRSTDVLSFAMQESGDEESEIFYEDDVEIEELSAMLGDVIISVTTAQKQSEEYGHSLERELGFLFVHGFLHLIGYDHQDEQSEKEMFNKQERILQEVGLTR